MDGTFGAKGDAKRVTDGAITAGTNQLSSAAAAYTSANTGQRVDVLGAGPAGAGANTLFAFIGTVSGGVAALVTTAGGSTPANATNTVSGATVTYGTEDTTAFQAAVTAISAAGGGVLYTPARRYFVNQVQVPSNVTIWGYGATVYFTSYNQNCGFVDPGTVVSNVGIYGLTMPYDNVTYGAGTRISIRFWTAGNTDLRFVDNIITNNKDSAIDIRDGIRVSIVNNTVQNCCTTAGRNAINVPLSAAGVGVDHLVQGNYVDQCPTYAINASTTGSASITSPNARRRIIGNTLVGNAAGGSSYAGIGFEGSGCGGAKNVIANNIVDYSATTTTASSAAGVSITQAIDKGEWLNFVVQGNYINHATQAMVVQADWVTITGNVLESGGTGINAGHATQSVTATLDGTTATLTSVTIPTGTQTPVTNGTVVSGTGIPAGSYLVSGAGTATWVISQATTAASTITVTASVPLSGVTIANNIVHMAVNSTGQGINATVTGSSIAHNQVIFDPGSASGSFGIQAISSSHTSVRGNFVQFAPAEGIKLRSSHDMVVSANNILNPSTAGGNVAGLDLYGVTGTDNMITDNRIVDDRAVPLMKYAIQMSIAGGGIGANLRIRGNTFIGFVTAAIDVLTYVVEIKNNAGYNPVGVVTVTVPATTVAVAAQPYDRTFYVTAGASTCTMAIQNGPSPVIPASAFGTIRVPAGKTVTPTFTNAPTWAVEGE